MGEGNPLRKTTGGLVGPEAMGTKAWLGHRQATWEEPPPASGTDTAPRAGKPQHRALRGGKKLSEEGADY